MDCLSPLLPPVSTAATAGFDNGDMLPDGFHWNDDHSQLALRNRVLILVAPATAPVMLSVMLRGDLPSTKYFVSHEMAIRYAARWVVKWEAEIRLYVGHGESAARGQDAVEARRAATAG